MKADLNGKVIVITGGSGGIGRAMGRRFASEGASVVLADIAEEPGASLVEEIRAGGGSAIFVKCDISDQSQVENLAAETEKTYGRTDGLINNVGVNCRAGERVPIDQYTFEAWDRIIKINLNGTYFCSRTFVTGMVKRKSGAIINISSTMGVTAHRGQSAFVTTKAGIINFTRSMALELAPHNIRVNSISPGNLDYSGGLPEESGYAQLAVSPERVLDHIPLKRFGTGQDIAATAAFLLDDDASYYTGHNFVCDGGWLCGCHRDW